jgi:hypothetical protein
MIENMVLDSFTYSIMAISAIVSFVIVFIAWSDGETHYGHKK